MNDFDNPNHQLCDVCTTPIVIDEANYNEIRGYEVCDECADDDDHFRPCDNCEALDHVDQLITTHHTQPTGKTSTIRLCEDC